jgi:hypothetical protein
MTDPQAQIDMRSASFVLRHKFTHRDVPNRPQIVEHVHDEADCEFCALLDAAARLRQAEQERDDVCAELEHLKSEYHYDMARGDSLIYAWEREEFDAWQRYGRERARQAEQVIEAARRHLIDGVINEGLFVRPEASVALLRQALAAYDAAKETEEP